MKNSLKISFVLALTLSMFQNGIAQNYGTSSAKNFDRCVRSIESIKSSKARCNNAISHFKYKPSTTLQLQQVCYYLTTDEEKYNLCVAAYPNIIDKVNFYNIYDSFSTFSNVMRLYHNTEGKNAQEVITQTNQQSNQQINDATFNLLVEKGDQLFAANKFNAAISVYEQAKTIKPNKFIILKLRDARRMKQDHENAQSKNKAVFDLLMKQGDKYLGMKQFDAAIVTYQEAKTVRPNSRLVDMKIKEAYRLKEGYVNEANKVEECNVSDIEFKQIRKAIKGQTFPDRQMKFAKEYIGNKCFSIEQYKRIIPIFNMDNDKLKLIKFISKHNDHPESMHSFRSMLTFNSTKKELDRFLLEKH